MPGIDKENGRSEKDISKAELRRMFREWHSDVSETTRGDNFAVMHILTELNTSLNENLISNFEEGWPETIPNDAKVDFPSGASIFLPETPGKFFEILTRYKEEGSLDPNLYSRKSFKRAPHKRRKEESLSGPSDQDPTLDKFWQFVTQRESIEDLLGAYDLFNLYSEEQLREINIPEIADNRAIFLFGREAWRQKSREGIELLIEEVKKFPYFVEENREHTLANINMKLREIESEPRPSAPEKEPETAARKEIERSARKDFVARVRSSTTLEELHALDSQAQEFDFFNRGELGVVRSVISRKMRKLEGI